MILRHRGEQPQIDPSAHVSEAARVCGAVTIGPGTTILAGAVLSAEGGPVAVGSHCVIMEHAVLRGTPGHPCIVGDHVLVGPLAHLSGCTVEGLSFLATRVTVLNGARIGRLGDVRVNALVHARTSLRPSTTVPIGWVAVGDPAELHPPGAHEAIWRMQRTLGFRDAAFRMGDLPREEFMVRMTRRYAEALATHRKDAEVTSSRWRQLVNVLKEGYAAGVREAGLPRRRPGPGE